ARVRVAGDGRRRVQVREVTVIALVRAAHGGIPRARIARAVKDQVQLRIVRPERPGRPAARLPRVALPRVVPRLPGPRDEIRPPRQGAAVLVVGLQGPPYPVLTPAEADDDVLLGDHGGGGDDRALLVVHDRRGPQLLAGLRVDRRPPALDQPDDALAVRVRRAAMGG